MEHRDIPAGQRHAPHSWVVADSTARNALSVTADDVGKYALQTSDHTEWMLVDDTPVVWAQRGAAGSPGTTDHSALSNREAADSHPMSAITGLVAALAAKATPSDITAAINALIDGAPSALNTLNELAAALADNADFAGAMTTALAGKGSLGAANAWTAAQYVTPVALTDAATVAVNAALSNNFKVVLGGNRTLGNPTNPAAGQPMNIRIRQDGTGNRTLAYGSAYLFPGGTEPVLSTAPNAVDLLCCVYDADLSAWLCTMSKDFQ